MQAATRDGRSWQPHFLLEIDHEKCIGCGRCFKICGRDVMSLKGLTADGEIIALDDDDEVERMIMVITDPGACIGCGACGRVCPKDCQTYETA